MKSGPIVRTTPACFPNDAVFALWRSTPPRAANHCSDCLPDYQQKMIAESRCAHPDVIFTIDKDGLIEGIRSRPLRPTQLLRLLSTSRIL